MYGGSGMWPIASTASSTDDPSSVHKRMRRRPKIPPLQDLAVNGVNSFKHQPRARLQFLPRVHQRFPQRARCIGQTVGSDAHLTHPVDTRGLTGRHPCASDRPGLLWSPRAADQQALDRAAARDPTASSRAGKTRVLLTTTRSPAREGRQRADVCMRHRAGRSVEMEQPRAATDG